MKFEGMKPTRLVSSDIYNSSNKVTPQKPSSKDNASVWHTNIIGDKNELTATQFLMKNLKESGYAIRDTDGDKTIEKAQVDFLMQNQLQVDKVENTNKVGIKTLSYAYEKQSPDADGFGVITKAELTHVINLKKSLDEIPEDQRTPEEVEFLKGFDEAFAPADDDSVATYEGDYTTKVKQPLYIESDDSTKIGSVNNAPKRVIVDPKSEREQVVQKEDGSKVLMSEVDMSADLGKNYVAKSEFEVERNYIKSDNKYKDVDDYLANVPLDQEKSQLEDNKVLDPYSNTRKVTPEELTLYSGNRGLAEDIKAFDSPRTFINPLNAATVTKPALGDGKIKTYYMSEKGAQKTNYRSFNGMVSGAEAKQIEKESTGKNVLGRPFDDNIPSTLVQGEAYERAGKFQNALDSYIDALGKLPNKADKEKLQVKIDELTEKTAYPKLTNGAFNIEE